MRLEATATTSSGTCGSSCRISAARCLKRAGAPLDLRVVLGRLVDELHARHGERIALEELQHAEALQALQIAWCAPSGVVM